MVEPFCTNRRFRVTASEHQPCFENKKVSKLRSTACMASRPKQWQWKIPPNIVLMLEKKTLKKISGVKPIKQMSPNLNWSLAQHVTIFLRALGGDSKLSDHGIERILCRTLYQTENRIHIQQSNMAVREPVERRKSWNSNLQPCSYEGAVMDLGEKGWTHPQFKTMGPPIRTPTI